MSQRNIFYLLGRILLAPFALIYGAVVWLRNRLYDAGVFSSIEFSPPVISVGNLSTGGTGKTPHVEYLIQLLQYRFQVATMSRGYKRRTQGFLLADAETNALRIGDEPMQYHMKYPELVVSVAEERITGIPRLLQKRPNVEVILLDDAYQHRSVKAGVNVLITDFSKPFYADHILPMGSLRESRSAYHRADVIIVSKCPPNLDRAVANDMIAKINPLSHQKVFFTGISYRQPYDFFSHEPVSLRGKSAVLVCCIAKPEPLVRYLQDEMKQVHVLSYADHHYFVSKDLEEIKEAYGNFEAEGKVIVTTEKDAARLHLHYEKLKEWNVPIIVLPIGVSFLFNQGNEFDNVVLQYVEQTIAENNQMFYGSQEI
ncbi:tetraacyldisaccharide 4'-kinase [Polluticoccus soli]|uniref:tetraacyldisaccharide 4'-kinase n=1 Tax=Polluticoccus soli TaxID=3034150 RepID=UPI0023E0A743|nr:tetraacyldisaccharide 4'-kinase [Flavipsychrobacter sp. JY13-12]